MEFQYNLLNIGDAAKFVADSCGNNTVIALYGDMGAGKTTLVKAYCELKGVGAEVSSPTYSIINEYGFGEAGIFHLDLYRLSKKEEAIAAGVEDCLYTGNTCFVEWPGIIEDILPPNHCKVYLTTIGKEDRKIEIL